MLRLHLLGWRVKAKLGTTAQESHLVYYKLVNLMLDAVTPACFCALLSPHKHTTS